MHWIYYAARIVTGTILLLLTRWQVTGQENVPKDGPLLIVSNHLSLADPLILGASFKRKLIFMAKEELFQTKLSSYFIRNLGAFPVKRGGFNRKTITEAADCLKKGMALVVFPEGQRSRDYQLQPAFPGSALLASRLGVPILPVGMTGTEAIKGLGWCLRRPRIKINIGPVFSPPQQQKLDRAKLLQCTNEIMEHIAALLPTAYRGIYNGKAGKNEN
ncbi:lysophospholipid acyltransferase family protein [Chloroflexota bacterium]